MGECLWVEFLRRTPPKSILVSSQLLKKPCKKPKEEKRKSYNPKKQREEEEAKWTFTCTTQGDPGSKRNKNSTESLKLRKCNNTEAWRKGPSYPVRSTKTKIFPSIAQFWVNCINGGFASTHLTQNLQKSERQTPCPPATGWGKVAILY